MAVEHAYGEQISQSPKPHPLLPNRLSSVFPTSLSVPTTNPPRTKTPRMCHSLKDPNHPALIPHSLWWTQASTVCPANKRVPRAGLQGQEPERKATLLPALKQCDNRILCPRGDPDSSPYMGQFVSSCFAPCFWLGILYPPNSYPHSILTLFFLISFPEALPRNPLKITSKIAIAFKPELA